MLSDVIDWIKCLFGNHDYRPDRAVDREEGGYIRHHEDGSEEPIPACYIVEHCSRCSAENRTYAAVDHAELFGVPKQWRRGKKTETERDQQ